MKLRSFFVSIITVATLGVTSGFASTIDLGINGDAQVGPNFINFGNYPTGTTYTPAPGYGVFVVSQPPLGVFLIGGVMAGESGTIQSLNATVTPPGTTLTPNPNVDLPFMAFDTGGSSLKLFLTELVPGDTTGPFSLSDSQNGAIASFNIDGFVFNTINKSSDDITGTFSATFNGETVAQLLAAEQGGMLIQTPFSGTLSLQTVPEPSTLLMFGAGLLGVSFITRLKIRK
jgi:PEP-CTERM motif